MIKRVLYFGLSAFVFGAAGCAMQSDDPTGGVEAPASELKGGKTATMSTPTLSETSATQTNITLQVCAGASGAPAGFSVQWMTQAQFDALGDVWPEYDGTNFCKASFSGVPSASTYKILGAYECATVDLGDSFPFDAVGASLDNASNCSDLSCGTTYVFRAFAHATSTKFRSAFSATVTASTAACSAGGGCTYTQGYWKQTTGVTPHYPNVWPAAVLTGGLSLGTVGYSADQLETIFNTPAAGNGLVSLAHQLEAAKLNIANGADPSAVAGAVADADALIGGLVVPAVGTGYLAPATTSALTGTLDDYNSGRIGPGHCE
jgi:hypothetical protein